MSKRANNTALKTVLERELIVVSIARRDAKNTADGIDGGFRPGNRRHHRPFLPITDIVWSPALGHHARFILRHERPEFSRRVVGKAGIDHALGRNADMPARKTG